jgi:hypothetical protein
MPIAWDRPDWRDFDEPNLAASAGLILPATLVVRLGLERLINATVHLSDQTLTSKSII